MNEQKVQKPAGGFSVSAKSFLISIAVIFCLMIVSYVMTLVIPGGTYTRVPDADGNSIIDFSVPFCEVDGGIPFWKWLLSPFLVLGASGNVLLISVIAFLLVISGVFRALEKCGLMQYMLKVISAKFAKSRYRLMAVMMLFFMSMGSLIGSFEECVPMIPIVVALAVALGWDEITGLAMSILSAGCGFAAGVFNPFTVGVAQKLAGLPMFSGAWLRAIAFVFIYGLLFLFVYRHAKKVERPVENVDETYEKNPKLTRALIAFASILGVGILTVFSSAFLTVLQDYTMIIVAVMFLVAGIVSALLAGMTGRVLGKHFADGVAAILPAVLMILMASSIKFILEEAQVLDTVLYGAVGLAQTLPRWAMIVFIYLLVLVMNFFIASGSAKAFMMIPLIVPLAQVFGIPTQLCVMAYAFGDGFSNVFYPTNAALLIGLNLVGVSYGKWAKWSVKFQLCNLLLTSLILLFGLAVGYC